MKTYNLHDIMTLAWQFVKQTGLTMSECLKKAWANYKLKNNLKKGVVRFYFLKIDGTKREAWGTLCENIIPQAGENGRKKNNTVQVYYDTEVKEYRCFKKFNLIH